MIEVLDSTHASFAVRWQQLLGNRRAQQGDVATVAARIIDDVRTRGDAAVLKYTQQFDAFTGDVVRLSPQRMAQAAAQVPAHGIEALQLAAQRIKRFHQNFLPQNTLYTDPQGVRLGMRYTPLDAVGLYVPGGTAGYPSSVLMNAIPAQLAGVRRLVVVVPTPNNVLNPWVMAALQLCNIDEIYTIGGAQAVAALAYGTATIAPVDKIVGPGNAYVAAAKRLVSGDVGIDTIAGPSEVCVLADATVNADVIALDLCAQAEHDANAQSICLTPCPATAQAIQHALTQRVPTLQRRAIVEKSLQNHGAIVVVPSLDTACDLINQMAPEHLQLAVQNPDALLPNIRHAGAIFLGVNTPEAVGDYVAGPNHVLPTCGVARFAGGLSVNDFLKHTTLIGCDTLALQHIGAAAVTLAHAEGLEAHALSISERLRSFA